MRPHVRLLACLVATTLVDAAPARAHPVLDAAGVSDPLVEESPRDRAWARMLGEMTLLFGAMEVKYWIDKEENQFDFQYDADWENVRARFITLDAWRFDDNFFNTNGWRHTAQGAANYLFARSNGFSSLQSYFATLAASGAWELFGEYKEEVSVNDLIMTPRAGFVAGEALWQHGAFLLRSEPTWYYRAVGNLLSGGTGLLRRLDGKPPWRARALDDLGLDAELGHQIESGVASGVQRVRREAAAQAVVRARLASEVIMIPGFERPGRASRLYTDPSFSELRVEWTWGERMLTDFEAFARVAVTFWHRKDISAATGDGYNLIYGLSSAYEYGYHATAERDDLRTRDRLAIGYVLGPTVDVTVYRSGLRVRAVADLYGDFGLVRNYAIDAHRALHPEDTVRSTILRDNYHHAFGVTARGRLLARVRGFQADLACQLDRFESVQGLDRHQEDIVDDYPLFDHRLEASAWASYGIGLAMGVTIDVGVGLELRDRSGTVKTTTRSDQERRLLGGARAAF